MRYYTDESCDFGAELKKGKQVPANRVYRHIINGELYAYCNRCQDCGCMVKVKIANKGSGKKLPTTGNKSEPAEIAPKCETCHLKNGFVIPLP